MDIADPHHQVIRSCSLGKQPVTHLATSSLCLTASSRGSVLMRTAQQGKQASSRIRIALWRITPTRFRFPLPYVWWNQADRGSNETQRPGEWKRTWHQSSLLGCFPGDPRTTAARVCLGWENKVKGRPAVRTLPERWGYRKSTTSQCQWKYPWR